MHRSGELMAQEKGIESGVVMKIDKIKLTEVFFGKNIQKFTETTDGKNFADHSPCKSIFSLFNFILFFTPSGPRSYFSEVILLCN